MGGKPRKPAVTITTNPSDNPVDQAMNESCLFITCGAGSARDFARRVAELVYEDAIKVAEDQKSWFSPYDYGHDGVAAVDGAIDRVKRVLEERADALKAG